jgi:hypothetical protein
MQNLCLYLGSHLEALNYATDIPFYTPIGRGGTREEEGRVILTFETGEGEEGGGGGATSCFNRPTVHSICILELIKPDG